MTDPTTTEDDESAHVSPGSRALGWLGAVALLLIISVLFMHVFAPTIARDESSPPGHPRAACIACHMVTGPTDEVEAE